MTKRVSKLLPSRLIFTQNYTTTAVMMQAIAKSKQLFSSSFLRYTMIMVVINFTIQFGYYGLWLWFPELFNKLNLYYSANPNATVTVCEVIDMQVDCRALVVHHMATIKLNFAQFSSTTLYEYSRLKQQTLV